MELLKKHGFRRASEIHVEAQLHGAVVYRRAENSSEVRGCWIGRCLAELRVIEQIEEVRAKTQASLVSTCEAEVLLEREVDIVDAGVPDIREVPRTVSKGLGRIARERRPTL